MPQITGRLVDVAAEASAMRVPSSATKTGPGVLSIRPDRKFIDGDPRNDATNLLRGPVVKLERRARLFDDSVAHHDDAIGHRHRFDLVVRDIDAGDAEPLVQRADLAAHLHAQLGVEVGQRFVEQEHLGVAHQRAAHRDALSLAAGKLAGPAFEQRFYAEHGGGARDALFALDAAHAAQRQRELHVLPGGHVRIECVVLEHHRDVAVARIEIVDDAPVDEDRPGADILQPGDHAQQRRLAAARGTHEHDKLAVPRLDVDASDHLHRAKILLDALDRHRRHVSQSPRMASTGPTLTSSHEHAPSAAMSATPPGPTAARGSRASRRMSPTCATIRSPVSATAIGYGVSNAAGNAVLREHRSFAVKLSHDPHQPLSVDEDGEKASETLHADADARVGREMNRHAGLNHEIAPSLSAAIDHHAFAAVLRDAERCGDVVEKWLAALTQARRQKSPPPSGRRKTQTRAPIPAKIVEPNRALRRALDAASATPMDWIGCRRCPAGARARSPRRRGQRDLVAVDRLQRVVACRRRAREAAP